jgi:hypothetical protein
MKKIPNQAYALALQLLRQTDMMSPTKGPWGFVFGQRWEA